MANTSAMFERRDTQQQSACCCCCRTSSRVTPQEGTYPGYDIIEVRPHCNVRVRHINPVPRDSAFEEEMQIVMQQHKTRLKTKKATRNKLFRSISQRGSQINNQNTHGGSGDTVKNLGNQDDVSLINESPQSADARTATGIDVDIDKSANIHQRKTSRPQRASVTSPKGPKMSKNSNPGRSRMSDIPLFLLHGVAGSADVWQAQIEYFSTEGFELIAPDMVGHGFSSAPDKAAAYHFDALSEDLLLVFDMYCKPQNIVIGHSYGASFAAVICRHRPSRVKKVVLISGGSPTPLAPQPGLFDLPVCFLSCCRPVLARGFSKSAFKDPSKSFIPSEQAFDVPSYVLRHMMRGQKWVEGNADYHQRYVKCPVMLIHGEDDALVTVHEEQDMEEAVDNCILFVLPDSSHMVMLEIPDKVNALIHEFIHMDTSTANPTTRPPSGRPQSALSLRSVKSIPNNLLSNNWKT